MTSKRSHIEIDPDYEDVTEVQCKRRQVLEEGAKETTKRKIESIIRKQFEIEVNNKESELLNISEKLEIARNMIDRLRACIVANFYGQAGQQKATKLTPNQAPMIHPTVRKFIGKAPPGTALLKENNIKQEPKVPLKTKDKIATLPEKVSISVIKENAKEIKPSSALTQVDHSETRTGRFKVKKTIIVGNVSKSIPADQRDENDQATHKWMVYVRGSKECPHIHDFVKKVWFFLHPSYMPNDLVEVSQPPFHLTRRGWGEFPVRIQLHFKDPRNKRLDIIHNLKLDRTYTGLQTLGAETVVNVEIERDISVVKSHNKLGKLDIKQEAMDTEQTIVAASLPNHVDQMKTEPSDDHGYGKGIFTVECPDDHDYGIGTCSMESVTSSMQVASKCQNVTLNAQPHDTVPKLVVTNTLNTMGALTVTNSFGAVASSSLIASQPLTLIPVVASLSQRVAPCNPMKDTFIQLSSISPTGKNVVKQSPLQNIVLKGLGAITSSSLTDKTKNGISVPNHLIQLSPVKGATKASVTLSIAQSNVFTNSAGNQPVKTGSPSLPQFNIRTNVPVNQSPNSSLIFLKCTDSHGKTYLIPQQVSPSSNSMIKAIDANSLQVVSTISQPILVSQGQVSSSIGMRIATNVSTGQQKCIMKSQIVGNAGDVSPVRSPVQNGPVLFIKPDNSIIMNKKSVAPGGTKSVNLSLNTNPIRVNNASSLHLVRNFSPKQGLNIVNFKAASPSGIIGGNHSLLRGQLKVTPQGLIHVHGQHPSSANTQSAIEQKVLVNGDIAQNSVAMSAQSKQPLSLLSTSLNNKLTILQSKGKSLLNPPVANMPRSQSNGNVIFFNQSNEMASVANFGQLVLSTGIKTKSDSSKIIDAATVLVQNKATKHSTPNKMVFVPLTSKENVPSTTSGIVCATSQSQNSRTLVGDKNLPSGVNSFHLSKTSIETKANDKTMFILVKNDTTKTNSVNTHGQKPLSSLLGPKSVLPFVPMATKPRESAITVSSSLNKEKQIIVVNGDCVESDLMNTKSLLTKEKKIMLDPKRNKSLKHTDMKEKEAIFSLCISDYPDMVSLIQAAVKRHPVVSESCGRQLHPYCAKTSKEWLSWNLGKRRASEWQRASSVRKFILPYLDDDKCYNGESVWTIKKILTWCRLHVYSPHYLERPLHPASIDFQIDISLPVDRNNKKFTSITNSSQIIQEMTSLQENVTSLESSDDEVDIISIDIKKNKIKKDLERKLRCRNVELMEGTPFIESALHKIGIHLTQTQVEPDFYATVSQGILYRAVEQFMGDILRETFAHQVNMGRYPDSLGVADVYAALNSLSITDFLTNKYMGVEESQGIPTVQR